MFKDKKKNEQDIQVEKELNFEELEQVTGGSLRDNPKTPTVDISDDTQKNV